MKISKKIVSLVGCFTLIGNLYGASFSCQKAGSFIEHTICNDSVLSKLDDDLAITYKNVLKNSSNKEQIKKEQFDWINNDRNMCQNVNCLRQSYTSRIVYFDNLTNKNSNNTNTISGTYDLRESSITINPDLSFSYINVNPRSGNMCSIESEKFTKVNKILIWQSTDTDCGLEINQIKSNQINLTTRGEDCSYYCGMNAYIDSGTHKKVK